MQTHQLKVMKNAIASVAIVLAGISFAAALQPVTVNVTFDESGGYKVTLSGVEWLRSGPLGIRDSGQWWANDNKKEYLLKMDKHLTETGEDLFGAFDSNM